MNRTLVAPLLAAVAACAPVPRSSGEFRDLFKGGARPQGGQKVERVVERPVEAVAGDVRRNADKCFNVVTRHSRRSELGYGRVPGRTTYRSQTRSTGSAGAEMVVRAEVTGGPEGGYFVALGDLQAVTAGRTRVTLYGPDLSEWTEAFDSVFAWAAGKASPCPRLP